MNIPHAEYIEELLTINSGGGVMLDAVVLKSGHVIGISDECLCVYPSRAEWEDDDGRDRPLIYFEDVKSKDSTEDRPSITLHDHA